MVEPQSERPMMSAYGVPASATGLLPWSWALERLHASHNFWLATTRPDGRPHLMPLWGLWNDDALYISTASSSRKAVNLYMQPACSISTQRADEAVIVEGRAEEVRDKALLARLLVTYMDKYGMGFPSDSPVFCIRPRTVFGFTEYSLSESATRWRFGG